MDFVVRIVHFLEGFINGASYLVSWLTSNVIDFTLLNYHIILNPLELVSIYGLTMFVIFAVAKWVLS